MPLARTVANAISHLVSTPYRSHGATDARVPRRAPKPHYRQPGWFTNHVFNPAIRFLTRRGVSIWGSRVLEVRGRTSGEPRRTPVNLLTFEDRQYLVSPRGETQWVRNARAAGAASPRSSAAAARSGSPASCPTPTRCPCCGPT